jgi:hypothetical protein
LVCFQRQSGERGHAQAGRHQSLDGHVVVGGVTDVRHEALGGRGPQQLTTAALAATDPRPVPVVGEPAARPVRRRDQVQRLVQQHLVAQARKIGRRLVGMREQQRHLDLATAQQAYPLGRLGLGEAQVNRGVGGREAGRRERHEGAESRRERRQPHPPAT